MQKAAEEACKCAINWIKKTIEVIDFAHQIEASISFDLIKSKNIIEKIEVGHESDCHVVTRDWIEEKASTLKSFAEIAKINIVSYQIIVLKESYASLFSSQGFFKWAEKSIEPDVWAAQQILKQIRNAFGHLKAKPCQFEACAIWDFTKEKQPLGKLEVTKINVVLDTTNLQGEIFNWNQIGGIGNFIKVLGCLIEDLEKKIKKYSEQNIII